MGTRTTVVVAGAVERTPARTRAFLLVAVAVEVEHDDDRQLALALDATPGARVSAPLDVRSAA